MMDLHHALHEATEDEGIDVLGVPKKIKSFHIGMDWIWRAHRLAPKDPKISAPPRNRT